VSVGRYPPAVFKGDGQSGGSYVGKPWRIVLHTTETAGLPSYSSGASAPHITYIPATRKFVQHTDFGTAARALKNLSGGVQTNRANALQLEIVCYSNKTIADQSPSRIWVGDLDDEHYGEIGEFVRWLCGEFKVSNSVRLPRPTPRAGASSSSRMSPSSWEAYNGLCGHFEVPENDHWDPGAFDFVKLVNIVKEDELTPEQEKALNYMVDALKSKSTDAPRWGSSFWSKFMAIWGSPPGPASPVTHLQLGFVWNKLQTQIDALKQSGTTVDATARADAARANKRLDEV
jgi:hypothetical protein